MLDISMWEVGFGLAVSAVTCGVLFGLRWFLGGAHPGRCPRCRRKWRCECETDSDD